MAASNIWVGIFDNGSINHWPKTFLNLHWICPKTVWLYRYECHLVCLLVYLFCSTGRDGWGVEFLDLSSEFRDLTGVSELERCCSIVADFWDQHRRVKSAVAWSIFYFRVGLKIYVNGKMRGVGIRREGSKQGVETGGPLAYSGRLTVFSPSLELLTGGLPTGLPPS